MIEKPQVNIFAICERVIRDRGGKPSLLGVFDVLQFPGFPAMMPFFLFTQITAPQGDYRIAVHLNRDDGLPRKIFESAVHVSETPGVANIAASIALPFDQAGLYEFRLYIDDVPRLTRPFHVRKTG